MDQFKREKMETAWTRTKIRKSS